MDPSTEVRAMGLEKFCKLVVLWEGVGPPAVDGRVPAAATRGWGGGRNLFEDVVVLGWPESVETKESDDESLRWEEVDCARDPVGDRGLGGGRKGGSWSLMLALCHTRRHSE